MDIGIEILAAALNSGLFAALFCFLFIFQLKDSKEREKKYNKTISALLNGLKNISGVDEKCLKIESDIKAIRGDCADIKTDTAAIKNYSKVKAVRDIENTEILPW